MKYVKMHKMHKNAWKSKWKVHEKYMKKYMKYMKKIHETSLSDIFNAIRDQ
jgi:hypothetical protein